MHFPNIRGSYYISLDQIRKDVFGNQAIFRKFFLRAQQYENKIYTQDSYKNVARFEETDFNPSKVRTFH